MARASKAAKRPATCPHCERVVPDAANYCPGCGAVMAPAGVAARDPGWYPDPFGRFPYRWWDGAQWSAYAAGADIEWDPAPLGQAARPRSPGLPAVGVALVGFVAGVGVSLLVVVVLRWAGHPGGKPTELAASELGLWSGLVGACVFVSRRRGTGSIVDDFGLRFRPIDIGLGLAGSFAARVTASIAIAPVVAVHPHFRAPDQSVFNRYTYTATGWAVLVVVVCVGAPLVEELFFRGLLQTRLVGRYGPVIGIAITSVLFGAAHLIGWQGPISLVYALGVAGGGVALGTVRLITGRLGTSILTHCLFNAQALLAIAFVAHNAGT